MKIIVKAKVKAKIEQVEKVEDIYHISVKSVPIDGKANVAIKKALAKYFDVAPSRISLIIGQTSKQKVFEIL
jgi:uncharacterized protein YggU (UPF0235/DUF167 family)